MSIFRIPTTSGPLAARVTMTLMAARALLYSAVRCPECDRKLMDVPGQPLIQVRIVGPETASGRGRVLHCKRCGNWIEVIEHR